MNIDFTRGRLGPSLVRFAIPFLCSSILQALYGAADLFIIGRFTDAACVSAVSIGSQIMQTFTSAILALAMGGTVLIGNAVGSKDQERSAVAVGNTVTLFAAIALFFTPLLLLVIDFFISLMNTPPEAIFDTRQYLFLCICGLPFIIAYNAVGSIFQGLGDSKTPVYFVVLACGINIVLDHILIRFFSMGVRGAAIATVAAQAISVLCTVLFLLRRGFDFPFHLSHFKPRPRTIARILRVGVPLSIQHTLVTVSFLIISSAINSLGLVASAAVGIVEKVITFAFLPQEAIAAAITSATAQNIGAQQPRRARQFLHCGIAMALGTGVLLCLSLQIWPRTFLALFSTDQRVISAAVDYIRAYSIDCIVVSSVFCMNSYFSGCGKTGITLFHNIISTLLVRAPLAYRFSVRGYSLFVMGLIPPAASLVSLIICLGYFAWLNKRSQKESSPVNG